MSEVGILCRGGVRAVYTIFDSFSFELGGQIELIEGGEARFEACMD